MPREKDMVTHIINSALNLILREGLHAATARTIAKEAGVSPGTLTYHFDEINQILLAVFKKLSMDFSYHLREQMTHASGKDDAADKIAEMITGRTGVDSQRMIVMFEMYAMGLVNESFRRISLNWMSESRTSLDIHFCEKDTPYIDAFIEGVIIHNAFSADLFTSEEIASMIKRISQTDG